MLKKYAQNKNTRIEYLINESISEKYPFVMSMGIWEPAFRAECILSTIKDRKAFALSYRGRGGSDAPENGYDWRDHATDLHAVLANEKIEAAVFLGFSKGVSYLLGYLKDNINKAKGLILVDFPAIHAGPVVGYADYWDSMVYLGERLGDHIKRKTLDGIERESTYMEFYDVIARLQCPIVIFRGTKEYAKIASNLTKDDINKYTEANSSTNIVDFSNSGHMIFDDECDKAVDAIHRFIMDNNL